MRASAPEDVLTILRMVAQAVYGNPRQAVELLDRVLTDENRWKQSGALDPLLALRKEVTELSLEDSKSRENLRREILEAAGRLKRASDNEARRQAGEALIWAADV